ncbi:pulmonary surfactant-associated protein A-like [Haliotis rubra]|uniref:pulmonary surfactant-associated protein A-like n=1 Tax=Haliotis rubra TaxID=36100 RepID=UPI001EE5A3E2|nr:pulmonary surfactant-associated protein A-like [Haliotis rubra]
MYPNGKAEMMCALICNVGSACSQTKIPWIQGFCDCRTDVSDDVHDVDDVDDVDEASAGSVRTEVTGCSAHKGYRLVTSVGMCVKFVTVSASYPDGKAVCEAEPGGRVVHVDTNAKIEAVEAIHRTEYGKYPFYIGLNDEPNYPRGDFRWTDGTRVRDNNWGPGQPDNNYNDNCVVTTTDFIWTDLYCSDKLPIICEITSFILA